MLLLHALPLPSATGCPEPMAVNMDTELAEPPGMQEPQGAEHHEMELWLGESGAPPPEFKMSNRCDLWVPKALFVRWPGGQVKLQLTFLSGGEARDVFISGKFVVKVQAGKWHTASNLMEYRNCQLLPQLTPRVFGLSLHRWDGCKGPGEFVSVLMMEAVEGDLNTLVQTVLQKPFGPEPMQELQGLVKAALNLCREVQNAGYILGDARWENIGFRHNTGTEGPGQALLIDAEDLRPMFGRSCGRGMKTFRKSAERLMQNASGQWKETMKQLLATLLLEPHHRGGVSAAESTRGASAATTAAAATQLPAAAELQPQAAAADWSPHPPADAETWAAADSGQRAAADSQVPPSPHNGLSEVLGALQVARDIGPLVDPRPALQCGLPNPSQS